MNYLQILSEGKVLLALFSYVKANEKKTLPQEWNPAQFEEIQLHALCALSTLCPMMIEDYMMCQGSTRLLLLLEWCVGSGKSFVWYTCIMPTSCKTQWRLTVHILRPAIYLTTWKQFKYLLIVCNSVDDYRGCGNSFHGFCGYGNKRAQMRHCLRLIRSMVSTGQEAVLADLTDQGAINQLTS